MKGGGTGASQPNRRLLGNLGKRGRGPEPRHWVKNGGKSTAPGMAQETGLER